MQVNETIRFKEYCLYDHSAGIFKLIKLGSRLTRLWHRAVSYKCLTQQCARETTGERIKTFKSAKEVAPRNSSNQKTSNEK